MTSRLLSASGLELGYGSAPVVHDISFELNQGDVMAIVGHNGSGKSTLIKTLLGYLDPLSGNISWAESKPNRIAYLGQRTDFDTRFPIRVRDLATMGAWADLGIAGRIDDECQKRVDLSLERTAIDHIADMPIHKLSAGQLQRALFARTMVQDAPLILLDEPFTAVDQATEAALLTLIDEWAAEGRTIIMVLHDLSAVLQHCNSALLLGLGKSIFGTPDQLLKPGPLVEFGYLSKGQASWIETLTEKPEQADA